MKPLGLITMLLVFGVVLVYLALDVVLGAVLDLLFADDNPPVDESRMDCFCSNVGVPQDVDQHEVTCGECGRYAELGGE